MVISPFICNFNSKCKCEAGTMKLDFKSFAFTATPQLFND